MVLRLCQFFTDASLGGSTLLHTHWWHWSRKDLSLYHCTYPQAPNPLKPFCCWGRCIWNGVGAVLTQQFGKTQGAPSSHFLKKLSPAEQNYKIGNQELLAVKLALKERHNWLEGVNFPFVIFTDHKNLEYLRTAKCLNPNTLVPLLCNVPFYPLLLIQLQEHKTRCISHIHTAEQWEGSEEPILPPSCLVGAMDWEVYQAIAACRNTRFLVLVPQTERSCWPTSKPE